MMRVVVDLQGAQTASRVRGVGRYSLSFAQALARHRGDHEVILVLNGQFPDTISPIREAFRNLLPSENIRIWRTPNGMGSEQLRGDPAGRIAQIMREAFIAQLAPDLVLITSLFEGLSDEALTSIGRYVSMPTGVLLYDLIPLIHRNVYLSSPEVERWYIDKVEQLKKADLLLSISSSSGQEAVDWLNFDPERVRNISSAAETHFSPRKIGPDSRQYLDAKYGLNRSFLMYTGGIDHRKNIEALIRSYAQLAPSLRSTHQLAIVCSVQQAQRDHLNNLATSLGLKPGEVILTGFVSEDDLILLYNACQAFVFPSWHEGFGLPVLEAMQCAKAVVASNSTSLPEVVGRLDALFDPHNDIDIAAKLARVLEDDVWRKDLEGHGKRQAQLFSWDITAEKAWGAIEQWRRTYKKSIDHGDSLKRAPPRLAFVSPLPPERSGISDYSAELLREITRHYNVEVIVDQTEVSDSWIKENCPIRTIDWFLAHHHKFDRVLYHFGNSHLHQHMFDLLAVVPGVVVLHDFFLSSVQAYREGVGLAPNAWSSALQLGHGFNALKAHGQGADAEDLIWEYPCNLSVLQDALGIIVHSESSRRMADHWYGRGVASAWHVIPLLRVAQSARPRDEAKEELGFTSNDFLICTFGLLGPTKLNHRLLDVFLQSPLSKDGSVHLIFVGENDSGEYGQKIAERINKSGLAPRIRIIGWTDSVSFKKYLSAADMAVQLRARSRGETSAAVLDCMNHGIPTIVNANGSLGELSAEEVVTVPDAFDDGQLVDAMVQLWRDQERRLSLGSKGQQAVHAKHAPDKCADQYFDAIEGAYGPASLGAWGVIRELGQIKKIALQADEWASALGSNFPPSPRRRQLLVDVSTLVQVDSRSGIQRVTRAILREWLLKPLTGWTIEPIYATQSASGYKYAREFTCRFLGVDGEWAQDLPVDVWQGDIFIGLDLQPEVVPVQTPQLHEWRNLGASIWFVLYDLLPMQFPQAFPAGVPEAFDRWLKAIVQFDGVACISNAVATDLKRWISSSECNSNQALSVESFHLGANIETSVPSMGLPLNFEASLKKLSSNPTFLAVGTLEPRKGYSQLLGAFELLWQDGSPAQLVIVGKVGWMMDELIERLRSHPEADKRLFWLEGISDEYLEKVYEACSCLVAASLGEGFGLPLIEAAQKKMPILARDLPVFREVAGTHATYFSGMRPEELSSAIDQWLVEYGQGTHLRSDELPWLTWNESAITLLNRIGVGEAMRTNGN